MSVIAISRELAALGDEIAVELKKRLSYRFADRNIIEERIKGYGLSARDFEKYDERKPSFFASISQERDDYLHCLKRALLDEARDGKCIFMGRGVFAVFKDVPGVLPVFLVSSMDVRIERVRSYFRCDEKRARQVITQSDNDRTGFHRYFFEAEWKDPQNYFLTINTGRLTPYDCAEAIANLADALFDEQTELESAAKLKELSLSQAIVNHVRYVRKIGVQFLEASVSGTTATLYGVAHSAPMVDAAAAAALEVPPIEKALTKIQIAQEYAMMR
ncbi:MAG: cytidylate kinase-like family protein [Spirochaetaceae bacterium]|jgi:cytidylate kinase|nr:cytidylate kinase-like family protein [Spirochaetaceae bacterium]